MPRSPKSKASATGVAKSAAGQARATAASSKRRHTPVSKARMVARRKAAMRGNPRSRAVRPSGTGTRRSAY